MTGRRGLMFRTQPTNMLHLKLKSEGSYRRFLQRLRGVMPHFQEKESLVIWWENTENRKRRKRSNLSLRNR